MKPKTGEGFTEATSGTSAHLPAPLTLDAPFRFKSNQVLKNRFMLAPMTNCQSYADGTLGDDELRWLSLRAAGGFGLTMTCASHVDRLGQGFKGQLGIYSDQHIPGHRRLTNEIHR
ncbi:MAG: hypothetical protein ACPGQS_15510, partial [Bradymonadia bacterium]